MEMIGRLGMVSVILIGSMWNASAFGWGCGHFPFVQQDHYTQKFVDRYTDMMTIFFDTDGDFKNDVGHVYKIVGYGSAAGTNAYPVLAETPMLVMVDRDRQGGFDEFHVDTTGTGSCEAFHQLGGGS